MKLSSPWLKICLTGLLYITLFNGALVVVLVLVLPWPTLLMMGVVLLILPGAIVARQPASFYDGIRATRYSDLKGGLLLGTLVAVLGVSGFLTSELYARQSARSSWLVYWTHPEMEVILPYPNQARVDRFSNEREPYHVTIDDEGLRITEHTTVPGAENFLNVLTLGDSYTFGFGVDDNETYPYFLERELEALLDNTEVTVQNGASIWMTLDSQLAVYRYFQTNAEFEPDVITLGYFGHNDLAELDEIPALRDTLRNPTIPPSITARSALIRWVQANNFVYGIPDYTRVIEEHRRTFDYDRLSGQYAALFDELVTAIHAAEQELYVLRIDGDIRYMSDDPHQGFIGELTRQYGIQIVFLEFVVGDYLEFDPHFSPQGNQHAAQQLAIRIAADYSLTTPAAN